MTRRTRAALALAVAAATAIALSGCNSSGSDAASSSDPTASPVTVAAAFQKVSTATAAKKSVKGHLSTTSSAGSLEGDFAYKFTPAGLLASFTFDSQGKSFKGVVTPQAIYVGGAGLGLPGGKSYLKVSLDESNPLAKTYKDLTSGFTQAGDLQASIDEWRSIGNLHQDGTETIDGVTATKYTGTVNPAQPPAGASADAKKAFAVAAGLGVTSIETTIWVDPDGLPLKVESTSTGGRGGDTTTVITYSDWGAAVDVAAPPASEVTDLSDVSSLLSH